MVGLNDLKAALSLPFFDPLPAHARMAPVPRGLRREDREVPPRQAGVLMLAIPENGSLNLVLTRRTEGLRGHSGQISFPGGSKDPDDDSLAATALRETCEELGLCHDGITVLGSLSPVYIPPTHFDVFPTVATMSASPVFNPNPDEVAEVFTLSLVDLLDERSKQQEYREIQGFRVQIPFYSVKGHKVWGATAVMLSELEHRLRAVLS